MGGFKVQGREHHAALELVADAKALAAAGCFAIVLEGVPDEVARMITDAIDVPTIGIGAGPGCDGQVLVYHDVLGIEDRILPKFVRRYADLKGMGVAALFAYANDVRSGAFPAAAESYHLAAEVAETLGIYGMASA
jgi:3-methyl-2-oxobutanoate hydroxymethyltransferase